LSQPLDESQAGHLFLPLCADLSVRFAARSIRHCPVLYIGRQSDPLYLTTLSTRRLLFQSVPLVLPLGAFGYLIVAVRMFLGLRQIFR